jgi:hypothetical protein
MATSTALTIKRALAHARSRSHFSAKPIVIRTVAPKPVKHHKRHSSHASGGLMNKERMGIVLGGFAVGFLQKQGIKLPALPVLGEAGTIGLAAYFLSGGGKNKLASEICTAALAVAAYELGSTGAVVGQGDVDGNFVQGYVAGF